MMLAPSTSNAGTKRNVAAVPVLPNDANINPRLLSRLQAAVERLATLDGQRGDPLDAALTRRDLVEAGVIKLGRNGSGVEPGDAYDGGGWKNIPYLDHMPTPDPPTFQTGIGVNFLFWKLPNARGVGATQIFRRTTDTDGVIIAAPVGSMYADLPVDYGVTYYYKIRYVSEKGIAGDWSTEVKVVSEQDPSYVIDMMKGKVDSSLLAASLRERVDVDGILDQAISAEAKERGAAIENEANTRIAADEHLAQSITTLSASFGDSLAALQTNYYTKADANSAIASSTRSLASKIFTLDANGNPQTMSAGFSENIKTTVNASGVAKATFESKVTANGRTAGFAYSSDGSISEFYINADRFAILSHDGSTQTTPFIVSGNKTYIDSAVIKDASITGAKIANATITTANIASLNVMNVAAGGTVSSSNYNHDTKTGWALKQDGSAEFYGANVTFGGKLEVRRVGTCAGVDISNTGIRVYDQDCALRVIIGNLDLSAYG